jgi:hypothetical protein
MVPTTYLSGTSLTAQIPASDLSSAGTASVAVQNPAPGGGNSNSLAFTISVPPNPVPTLTSLLPSNANAGGSAFTLTVSGTNFVSTSQVLWDGSQRVTTFVSSTLLTAQILASDLGSSGTATVTVQSPAPGGGTSGSLTFTINSAPNPTPTVTSLSPSSGTVGGAAFTLTVTGSNFVSTSQVLWNGSMVPTTFASSSSLSAQIPAADLSSSGTASVAVQNPAPGGGTSAALTFTINPASNPVPTVSSLSPSSANAGAAAFTLAVSGTNFIASSQVLWNGGPVSTTYLSGTSMTATIPASDLSSAGTASVAVQNPTPGGGTSAAATFTINPALNSVPTISSISPSSAVAGTQALTLTVSGTQFIANSEVLWNGAAVPTTYISATSLTAAIPTSDLSSVGTASVAVQNPAPGGGASASLTFTINSTGLNLTVLGLEGTDIAWNSSQQKLYVSVPSSASTNGNTITVVNPIAGTVVSSQSVSSEPYGLAISDDNQYLYGAINGGATIQRFILPGLTPDIQFSLGTDPFGGSTYLAGDMKVQPGAAHTLAISYGDYGTGLVGIFDDGVERPNIAGGGANSLGNALQWRADGGEVYSALAMGSDSPYWTSGSGSLYTLSVSPSGVSLLETYASVFRREGVHLHADPTTGYVYDDWGEVVNAATGIPVGDFRISRPYGVYSPGMLSVVDPGLQRYFTLLEVNEPDGTLAFQIQAFDQTTFQLLSTIVIPNAIGAPTNFIRWGQSGLAMVTNGSGSLNGKLYLLDGTFVNPSGVEDTTAGTPLNPVPTLTSISPITATVGGAAVTLTVTGRDFVGQPTVFWNGSALPTTLVNNTEVQAQIPASDLAAVAQASITASNTASDVPLSNSMPFSVNPVAPAGSQIAVYGTGGNDLVWDANAARIYVSTPGIQGDAGDGVVIVDPVAGTVATTGFLGSDPANLSISSDGQYLYAAMYGQNAIQQLTLPDFQVNNAWNLGADSFFGPYYALDLQAAPEAPHTTAVILANFDISPPSKAVVIYDDATPRPTEQQSGAYIYSWLQWAGNDTTLYSTDEDTFLALGVTASGVTLDTQYPNATIISARLHFDAGTGLIYTDGGQVLQPSNGSTVGNYGASGIAVPDSTLDRVFILGQTTTQVGTLNYTIESFDQSKFTAIASITIDNVVGTPTALIRWGANGLAFTTRVGAPPDFNGTGPGQLYVISGDFVNPSTSSSRSTLARPIIPVRRTWSRGASSSDRSLSVVAVHDSSSN